MTQNKEQTHNKKAELKARIAAARRDLHLLWDAKGCTDAEVLKASIELDLLINEYYRLGNP